MEQLDLNHVRTFVRLVELGSFTKAAAVLRQPKSRVSRWLQSLERDLGVQLIYRTTRQFQLTESGRIFYERAKNLVEGLDSLSTEVRQINTEISGLIRITASDDMGTKVLPSILDDFMKIYPSVKFEVLLTQSYVDLVQESIDVALRVGSLKDSSLRAKKVGVVHSIFVATPGFLERHRQWEDLEHFANLPFISLGNRNLHEAATRLLGKKKKELNEAIIANNPAFVVEFALRGRGVAYVPEFLVTPHIRAGRLIHVHKNLKSVDVPVSLVIPDQKETPLKIKKFLEFTSQKLKEIL